MYKAKKLKLDDNCHAILPDELLCDIPLIEVYVAKIKDKKTLSKTIISLNSLWPIPELLHLKRVRNCEILLFPIGEIQKNDVREVLRTKGFNMDLIGEIRVEKVAKVPPKIRKQWEIINELWPCNFHPNKYLEKLVANTLFSFAEMELHKKFMRIAIEIGKLDKSKFGCCIIDPKTNSVIAIGYNETLKYPCRHSIFVAIDNVAKTQLLKADSLDGIPEEFLILLKEKFKDCLFGLNQNFNNNRYLCTDYVVYSTHEPCIACAMALVHSRVKRIFFGRTSMNGGLGSLCKIHVVENLNHHYEAFGGLLESECLLL